MAYRIIPLRQHDVRRAAAYLHAKHGDAAVDALAAAWTWRLFENPVETAAERGHLLVTDDDVVSGVQLAIPQRFRAGERTLLGVCSSAFYVDAAARMQGLLLYRRFRAQPVDLWFSTTSNATSGENWRRNGGSPVVSAQREIVVPLRPGRVANALFASHHARPLLALAAACAGPVMGVLRRRQAGSVILTDGRPGDADWQALSDLAQRTPFPGVTALRDAQYLQWRYAGGPDAVHRRVWRARDAHGREGWVAAAQFGRVFGPALRSWMVMDYAWPADTDATPLLMATARALADDGDLLAIRGRARRGIRDRAIVGMRRRFPVPSVWVKAPYDAADFDIVPADGDTVP